MKNRRRPHVGPNVALATAPYCALHALVTRQWCNQISIYILGFLENMNPIGYFPVIGPHIFKFYFLGVKKRRRVLEGSIPHPNFFSLNPWENFFYFQFQGTPLVFHLPKNMRDDNRKAPPIVPYFLLNNEFYCKANFHYSLGLIFNLFLTYLGKVPSQ